MIKQVQDLRTDTTAGKVGKTLPTLHIEFNQGFCVSPEVIVIRPRY